MHRIAVDDESQLEMEEVERAARGGFGGRELVRGNLAAQPFPEVLTLLHRGRQSGALLLRRDKVKKIVHLRDGLPVLVKSNLLSECLGRIMVRERMITEADCETSIQRMKETGRQQGALLVEMKCISPHNLTFALSVQLETKLYEVFSWLGGDYQFNPQAEVLPSVVTLDQGPAALILEGIKRSWSSERIKQHLHGQMDQYAVPHAQPIQPLSELKLTEKEQAFVQLMDGTRTLRELTAISPLTPLQTWWLLYGMVASQMVALSRTPPESTLRTVPPALPSGPPALPALNITLPPPLPARTPSATSLSVVTVAPARTVSGSLPAVAPEKDRVEALTRRLRDMRRLTHFEVLGVSRLAITDEVRKAYLAQARDHHPDRHPAGSSQDIKTLAEQIYALLSNAYECLSDTREREEYVRHQRARQKGAAAEEVARLLGAETAVHRAETLLARRDPAGAAGVLEGAVAACPEDGELHCELGWARQQQDPRGNSEVARKHLERGLELSPRYDRGHVFLGTVLRLAGQRDLAHKSFEQALSVNPDNADALRELRRGPAPSSSDNRGRA